MAPRLASFCRRPHPASMGFVLALTIAGSLAQQAATPDATLPTSSPGFSRVPGTVVSWSPAASRIYLGSPAIAVWTNGDYLISHDFFGPGSASRRTAVFGSSDRGRNWTRRSEIDGAFWSSLFVHRGALHLLGTSRQDGDLVIRRSLDGGRTWTEPRNGQTGLLRSDAKYHCAPVPVVVHAGRVWRAMEDIMGPGGWGRNFRAFVLSAPEDADLLVATNWLASTRLGHNAAWLDGRFGGWLEGNVVVTPTGGLVNMLRVDFRAGPEKAALQSVSADGRELTFDPASGFVHFPGGCKKFTVRFDPVSGLYWSLSNHVPERHRNGNPERTRNTLALVSSPDLRDWRIRSIVLYHPDTERHGFQYADWLFEGDDLIAAVRTAHDDSVGGAHRQHDANLITFHRIAGFRTRTAEQDAGPR